MKQMKHPDHPALIGMQRLIRVPDCKQHAIAQHDHVVHVVCLSNYCRNIVWDAMRSLNLGQLHDPLKLKLLGPWP